MRRSLVSLLALGLLAAIATGPVAAKSGSCPSSFQAAEVNADWELGQPIPTDDLLWNVTVLAGLAAEDMTLDEAVELFGFTSVQDFYAFVLAGWVSIDKNADDVVCFKAFPTQSSGKPAYFSNFIDNNAQTK